ncbi:MAG: hypothetical protein J7J54_03115 [Candidatus Omnitrophica bacterium]|nr:hypothetical protein [Candidatus Omnitrophota bacterium]
MIKNKKLYEQFNREYLKRRKLTYRQAIKIYESLWEEACKLRVLSKRDTFSNIESRVRIARVLNWKRNNV